MLPEKGIKIKFVISLLVVLTVCSVTATNWYISTNALRTTVIENVQQNNFRYAQKLSISTSELLDNIQHNLSVLANKIGQEEFSQSDLDDWHAASGQYYNSLFTTDANGVVQLMPPKVV